MMMVHNVMFDLTRHLTVMMCGLMFTHIYRRQCFRSTKDTIIDSRKYVTLFIILEMKNEYMR